ncbi:MAG: hypothetical protein A2Z20_08185 [Bdellovibrionales bacterium RBG_16_40_8]|nr:MAG: hypothetical protein A2Z20_08185 [Bdellovibrionales bacterium RBG_16_40_8]
MKQLSLNSEWMDLEKKLKVGAYKYVLVAGPECNSLFSDLENKIKILSQAPNLVWLTAGKSEALDSVTAETVQIPLKTFIEKDGTYTNYMGIEQKVKRGTTIVAGALTLTEAVNLMSGHALDMHLRPVEAHFIKNNFMTEKRGTL